MSSSKLAEFQVIKKLGDGAYSSVYKVKRNDDNEFYALKKVKMLQLSDKEKENALNEVRILASIEQPNVIGFKDAFIDDPTSSLCLVMEYADNGDVFQKICNYQKRETYIKEKKIWYVFIQIVRGLRAFHVRKILHRDMKSANIFLFKDMQAKLGDLNVSKIVKKGLSYTQTGTPYYASPEVWKDMPYDSKSDIWSLGCVLYEMCALVPPFRADDMQGLYKMVVKGKYPRIPDHFSQEMATVIKFMLQIQPNYRPSTDQILALPIVESLSKKFFPEELQHFENLDDEKQALLKTIRISKNLFSLTERLPKNKYMARNRSNDVLQRQISQDSNIGIQSSVSLIQPGKGQGQHGMIGASNFGDKEYPSASKVSQKSRRNSNPSNNDEENPDVVSPLRVVDPQQANQRNNRNISKPKGRNKNDLQSHPLAGQQNRSPSLGKGAQGRGLSISPSNHNIRADSPDYQDEDQPQKPIMHQGDDDDERIHVGGNNNLPSLAQRHRSVNVVPQKQPRMLQNQRQDHSLDADSQNQQSYGALPKAESPIQRQRGSVNPIHNYQNVQNNAGQAVGLGNSGLGVGVGGQPRVISKVRGDKVMHVYSNSQKQNLAMVYGNSQHQQQSKGNLPGINLPQQRRQKLPTVRGNNDSQLQINNQNNLAGPQSLAGGGLQRSSSKPQLQLPDINIAQIQRSPNAQSPHLEQHQYLSQIQQQSRNGHQDDYRSQRLVSAHLNIGNNKNISPLAARPGQLPSGGNNNGGDIPSSPKLPPREQQQKLMLVKPKDGGAEWGTLPANAMQHAQLSPVQMNEQRRRGGAKPVRAGTKVESVIDQEGSEAGTADIEI